jgi:rsbT antagonist protein RsbS
MIEDLDRLPIIKLWNLILVPMQGDITDALADRLRQNVLETINTSGAEGLVIDVTGVWMIDSHLCAVISNLAASARLMGTRSIICGMSAEIALTLQTMGVDLAGVQTALTVEEAFAMLGVRPVKKEKRLRSGLLLSARQDRRDDESPRDPVEPPPNRTAK